MKKFCFGIVFLGVVLAMSCRTAPGVSDTSEDSDAPSAEETMKSGEYTQDHANTDFERAYEIYKPQIILEGAAKYTVVPGDSLSKIAIKNYGSANHYGYFFPLIMLASDVAVPDPELIEPGMVLTIPQLQRNLDNPGARAAIKMFLLDIAAIYQKKDRAYSALTETNLIALSNSL